ncbi:MAG: hypothetical protein IKI84_03315 [Clostridia bacterium]|nr:hypothetical protein [Clostridia bacterium]
MDIRKALPKGTVLHFEGLACTVEEEVGRGSNAIVYRGFYKDTHQSGQIHRVLVKELFPMHPQGKIFRDDGGRVTVEEEGRELYEMHRNSFEAGNRAHLALLEASPDGIGSNLNTCEINGTLYTLLGVSGGESLEKLQKGPARLLRQCASRMLCILDALEVFHRNALAHLDIAPDNIIMIGSGKRERALLIDYNSCMVIGPANDAAAGTFSIKQGYTAPEIRAGRLKDISFASDMYSVTAVFYRLLTGTPLTNFQMIRADPPDVSGCPCMEAEADTVRVWVREILRRGLQTLPSRRYRSTAEMRRDLEELVDRIDGVGITHWALWEAGRRQAERLVRENPSLAFIRDSAKLFPALADDGERVMPVDEAIGQKKENCMLVAGGGMGKTTALLHMVFASKARYSPRRPAMMYMSLYGRQEGEKNYIIDGILDQMRFSRDTHTFDDARKALFEVLDRPADDVGGDTPALILLLDGLNEVQGDTKPLLDEILRLSALRSVRLVVAGRRAEEALRFSLLQLTELSDEAVKEALSASGLLLPESEEMKRLLRTPMMLAMYLSSGSAGEKQVKAKNADELMKAYLDALKEKAVRDMPEDTGRRWQIEAASDMVLPAISAEITRKGRSMEDGELLPAVEKCFRLLTGTLSRRFFPRWIGRTAAIRGEARNAEEWYGIVVHDILWKQLGLVMRDETGRVQVSHQAIGEYLLGPDKANRRRIRRYYRTRILAACVMAGCLTFASVRVYRVYILPPPYNEMYADNVMSRALDAYISAGKQYSVLADLTASAMESPEEFQRQLIKFNATISYKSIDPVIAGQALERMLSSGKVMPWSGKPMDEKACRSLMGLSENRGEEYARYADVLIFVMSDETAFRYYGKTYPELLAKLLETDATITAEWYRIVLAPHATERYGEVRLHTYNKILGTVTRQNEHLNDDDPEEAARKLAILEGRRTEQEKALIGCGAFYMYDNR